MPPTSSRLAARCPRRLANPERLRTGPMSRTIRDTVPCAPRSSHTRNNCEMNCNDENRGAPMKAMIIVLGVLLAAGGTDTVNFDTSEVGTAPGGWTATQTGGGQAKWEVVQDNTAPSKPNVLRQSGQ